MKQNLCPFTGLEFILLKSLKETVALLKARGFGKEPQIKEWSKIIAQAERVAKRG